MALGSGKRGMCKQTRVGSRWAWLSSSCTQSRKLIQLRVFTPFCCCRHPGDAPRPSGPWAQTASPLWSGLLGGLPQQHNWVCDTKTQESLAVCCHHVCSALTDKLEWSGRVAAIGTHCARRNKLTDWRIFLAACLFRQNTKFHALYPWLCQQIRQLGCWRLLCHKYLYDCASD